LHCKYGKKYNPQTMKKFLRIFLPIISIIILYSNLAGSQGLDPIISHTESADTGGEKIVMFDNWHCKGNFLIVWRYKGPKGQPVGNQPDLSKYRWNKRVRSVQLFGAPGSAAWLHYDPNYSATNGVLQIKIPEGFSSVCVDNLSDPFHSAVTWITKGKPLTSNCQSIQWK
jgi:hypothetical protein